MVRLEIQMLQTLLSQMLQTLIANQTQASILAYLGRVKEKVKKIKPNNKLPFHFEYERDFSTRNFKSRGQRVLFIKLQNVEV